MTKRAFMASTLELQQLRRCQAGEDISSSDRASDAARQRLRRAGLLTFSRPGGWMVTNAGRDFLAGRDKIEALTGKGRRA